MRQKVIFFDIDDTLLNSEKKLPQSAEESIHKLQDKGYTIAIATGRSPFTFKDLRERLDIHSYVSLNGQYVVHNDQVIYKHPLDFTTLKQLMKHSKQNNHPLLFISDTNWQTNSPYNKHVEETIRTLKVPYEVIFDAGPFGKEENLQVILFCEDSEEDSYKQFHQHFDFVRWHEYATDVLPKGGSKAIGVKHLLKAMGIDKENAYAFGDGLNDIEMLKWIPNSVAMGNAAEVVQNSAQIVTTSVEEDGIANGLQKLGLLP